MRSAHEVDLPLSIRAALAAVAEAASPVELRVALSELHIPEADLAAACVRDASGYARAELVRTPAALVVLIASPPGRESEPHDHGGSLCFFRVLAGVATEKRFGLNDLGEAELVDEDLYLPGAVVECEGDDIHSLGNDRASALDLVTLHVYMPCPSMREYRRAAGVR